jgi:hypothetical protein
MTIASLLWPRMLAGYDVHSLFNGPCGERVAQRVQLASWYPATLDCGRVGDVDLNERAAPFHATGNSHSPAMFPMRRVSTSTSNA